MWQKNIKQKKRNDAQSMLGEKLFFLQKHFSESLLKHRKNMLEMSQKRFVDTCAKNTEALTIEKFKDQQFQKQEQCRNEIEQASEKSRNNIRKCIGDVLKELRERITSEIYLDETRKAQPNQANQNANMKRKENNDVFQKLQFPAGMTYGHRSQLRSQCIKFLRYAYLVDFLSMEALSKIYTSSVDEMIRRLTRLDESGNERIDAICDTDNDEGPTSSNQAPRGFMPLFYLQIVLDDSQAIPPDKIKQEPIEDFVPPPRGTSKTEDFNLLEHIEMQPEKDENEESESSDLSDVEPVQKYRSVVPTIHDEWIQLHPTREDFIQLIQNTFSQGQQVIKSFVRWNKHRELLDYSKVLEDWDWEDTVGDDWDTPDTDFLSPDPWITDDPIYKAKETAIRSLLESADEKSKRFLKRFQPILQIYWTNKQFQIGKLLENVKSPVEYLQFTIELLIYYKDLFVARLPAQTDIGLLHLDSKLI